MEGGAGGQSTYMLPVSAVHCWDCEQDAGRSGSLGCAGSMVRMMPRGSTMLEQATKDHPSDWIRKKNGRQQR
jgi:hypothetical protein